MNFIYYRIDLIIIKCWECESLHIDIDLKSKLGFNNVYRAREKVDMNKLDSI